MDATSSTPASAPETENTPAPEQPAQPEQSAAQPKESAEQPKESAEQPAEQPAPELSELQELPKTLEEAHRLLLETHTQHLRAEIALHYGIAAEDRVLLTGSPQQMQQAAQRLQKLYAAAQQSAPASAAPATPAAQQSAPAGPPPKLPRQLNSGATDTPAAGGETRAYPASWIA